MNLAQLLARSARVYPQRPALYLGEDLICDYRGLAERAARIGQGLRRLGLAPGDRIAIFMHNCPEYLEVLYGAWYAGLAVVPINAKLHPREVEYILQDCAASALFVSPDLADGVADIAAGLRAVLVAGDSAYAQLQAHGAIVMEDRANDDLAWLFYTSGTTGRPKGVMQSHGNLWTMIACHFMDVAATRAEDSVIYAAPMSHAAGMGNFAHMACAARHVIARSASFDPAEILALAQHHRRAFLFAAPTMVKRLADHAERSGADASGFSAILYGGGPMYVEDLKQAQRVIGDRFVQIYGQGESPMTITVLSQAHLADRGHPQYLQRIASVGVAQSLVEVRVADEDGRVLPDGVTGEILVRGPSVMLGYWNNPEATAKAIRDGWLYTGDVGCFDADGFLTLKDRSKDMIISGGSNIYPREVEEVLLLHPDVHEVSVVGRDNAEWGEEVIAFVVARPGAQLDEQSLDAVCLHNMARFKRPKEYRFVADLPKNNYGKVLKTDLREQLKAERRHAVAAAG